MPTVATPTSSRSAVTRTRGSGVVIGVAVVLAVAVLLIALFSAGSHGAARAVPQSGGYTPLIQYRGTGALPATQPSAAPASLTRAEHGYGLVP